MIKHVPVLYMYGNTLSQCLNSIIIACIGTMYSKDLLFNIFPLNQCCAFNNRRLVPLQPSFFNVCDLIIIYKIRDTVKADTI